MTGDTTTTTTTTSHQEEKQQQEQKQQKQQKHQQYEPCKSIEDAAVTLCKQRHMKFQTEKGRMSGFAHVPLSNEVIIATNPKAGTTWMQHMCHQIRYFGQILKEKGTLDDIDLDRNTENIDHFIEISYVVPYLELAYDLGQTLTDEQPYSQHIRLFKTHAWYNDCPAFRKVIVVNRSPEPLLVSFYHFFEDWFYDKGTISLTRFANEFFLQRDEPLNHMQNASYFVHLISWYKRYMMQLKLKKEDNNKEQQQEQEILMIFYEDMIDDLRSQVERVAKFLSDDTMDYTNNPKLIDLVVQSTSYNYMKEHEDKFDERLGKTARNAAIGLSNASLEKTKISSRNNNKTMKQQLSQDIKDRIQAKWMKIVEPVTGCSTYEEFRQKMKS